MEISGVYDAGLPKKAISLVYKAQKQNELVNMLKGAKAKAQKLTVESDDFDRQSILLLVHVHEISKEMLNSIGIYDEFGESYVDSFIADVASVFNYISKLRQERADENH